MTKIFLFIPFLLLMKTINAQDVTSLNIIPEPVSIQKGNGVFLMPDQLNISGDIGNKPVMKTAQLFKAKMFKHLR